MNIHIKSAPVILKPIGFRKIGVGIDRPPAAKIRREAIA
jgi:hypothetical protein